MDSLTAELHAWKSLTNTCVKGPLTWHSSPSRQGGGEAEKGKGCSQQSCFPPHGCYEFHCYLWGGTLVERLTAVGLHLSRAAKD